MGHGAGDTWGLMMHSSEVSKGPTYFLTVWHGLQAISSYVLWARQKLGGGTPQLGAPAQEAVSHLSTGPPASSVTLLRLLLEQGGESVSFQTHRGEHCLTL